MFDGKNTDRNYQRRRKLLRVAAGATSLAMSWLTVGPAGAATFARNHQPKSTGHTRTLTPIEMKNLVGSQIGPGPGGGVGGPPHLPSTTPSSGGTYPWEGNSGSGVNTGNGNKMTSLPLVQWNARGGRLAVSLALTHNSQSNHNSELGHKWTHSYDIYSEIDPGTGDFTVHWGDDLSYTFAANISGGFDSPTGIHDILTVSGTGTSATYSLKTKDQLVYVFTYNSGASGWYCDSITDRNGNAITIAHNSGGYVTTVTDPTSRAITFSYTSGKLTSVSDPLSRTWSFSYDSNDDLVDVDFPAVSSTTYDVQYAYNANHDITTFTDLRGKNWTFAYNSDDSLSSETDPLSHSTTYIYTTGYSEITDANSHSVKHYYNSNGEVSSTVDAAGETESYTYDSDHNMTQVTDKRGHDWDYTLDSMGNILTKTDPFSHTMTWTYNSKNDPLSVKSELGHEIDYTYDTNGNQISVTDALSHSTTYGYDSFGYGEVVSISDPLSHSTTLSYDSDGNVVTVTDALSHYTSSVYDAIGRKTSTTGATGKTKYTAYDSLGRVTSITEPGSRTSTFTYDAGSGLQLSVTDPLSNTNSYTYDDAARVTSHTNPNSVTVFFSYDNVGNKTGFTDGNSHTTYYSYTNRNEISAISYPDSTSEFYTYNATGKLYTKTDGRGVVATQSYDNVGRLTGISFSDSTSSISFSYDDDNHKVGMSDGTGTYTYSYDDADHLTQQTTPNLTVSFAYDNAGRLTTRTLGMDTTTFTYDNTNLLTSLSAPGASGTETTSYTYDNASRLLTTTFANGDIETDSYSSTTGELTSVVHQNSASTTINSHAYTYQADGRKTSETLADGSVISYGYDNNGALTSESKVDSSSVTVYTLAYTYDGAGNRTSRTLNGGTPETYTYDDANKLTTAGNKNYTYDAAGNVESVTNTTTSITTDLTWDAKSRLTSINDGVSVNASYAYNGKDQRTEKIDSASNAFNYTHQGDRVDSPLLSDGVAKYTQGLGIISEVRGGTSKFYHMDGLGSTRALTSVSGVTTDTHEADAFGNTISGTGSTPTPFGMVANGGYQTDQDTGLMLLGHRYYDPSTGRFLSRDPVHSGYNWYTYCSNDPVNSVDPQGLEEHPGKITNSSTTVQYVLIDFIGKNGQPSEFYPVYPGVSPTGPPAIVRSGGTTFPAYPITVVDPENGIGYPAADPGSSPGEDPRPAKPGKYFVPLQPGQSIGGPGTGIDAESGWVPKKGWIKSGEVGWGGAYGEFNPGGSFSPAPTKSPGPQTPGPGAVYGPPLPLPKYLFNPKPLPRDLR